MNTAGERVVTVDKNDQRWVEYVDRHPDATHYHRLSWAELIRTEFRQSPHYLMAMSGDKVEGVLPLVRLNSRLFGHYMVSMPYLNYGGIVADNKAARALLQEAATELGRELGVTHIEYREQESDAGGMPVRTDKVSMILDLPASIDDLGKAIGSKRRSQVRRPLRENPEIRVGGEELVPLFYDVFARNMRDLGTPVYARSFYERMAATFPNDVKIVAITVGGQPAAAAFLIGHREQLEIPWASTVRDFNRISINMLLYWEVLRFAIDAGYRRFDFGRSTVDAGTYRFKLQWGAEPKQLYWHYWLRDGGEPPKMNPDNPKYARAIRMWQRLPIPVANLLGPRIIRNLP
ncbi:MAG: FemAB family XrtA/PEP-CTERM system-associated protein [Pseudomonadota bacterium]